MTILLDSHALVWYLAGDRRCSRAARDAIESDDEVLVSAVTAWELSNKYRLGKWPEVARLVERFAQRIAEYSWQALPVTLEHAQRAGLMAAAHRDPFDRLLAAQAEIENVALVTADPAFRAFGTRTLW
jgi:PIN domain nuclease of toxin-antitoxin system